MQTVLRAVTVTLAVSGLLPVIASAQTPSAPIAPPAASGVTAADIRAGLADPTRWLTFSGDYTGQRHSPLTQITPRTRS